MDAVVTAGGRLTGAFAAETGVQIKALIEIAGRTLLERTVSALAGSERVDRIAVVGPQEVREVAEAAGATHYVPEEGSGIDNLMAGIRALKAEGQILMATSDLVVVQPEDIDDLIGRVPASAALSYVVVTSEEFLAAFPKRENKHFIGLRDGRFVGGCVFVVDVGALQRIESELRAMFLARKLPVVLASFVGGRVLVKFALARLLGRWIAPSTAELKTRVERALGCEAIIVRGASPHLALDVDTRRDWRFALEHVAERESPGFAVQGAAG
jgi:GTP:adenosylcobinamide-phosphate guanylyltransferase